MDMAKDIIYGGLAGPDLPVPEFDFGRGITISTTYAHLMASFLMAFSPAKPGKSHPAPWRPAKGGFGFDVVAELKLAEGFGENGWFDRLNTIWWFVALLRFVATPNIRVLAIANRPFREGSDAIDIEITPVEVEPKQLLIQRQDITELTLAHLEWVKEVWYRAGKLMGDSPEFNTLFQAADQSLFARTPSLALLSLWGALEAVFSPARTELRFRVSSNIAAFLEEPGAARLELQKKTAKLYDARSATAHGSKSTQPEDLLETFLLTKRVIAQIIETDNVPSKEKLEQRLFCVSVMLGK